MAKRNKRPKPPHPPRELCTTFTDWILGIVSPSKVFMHATWGGTTSTDIYFEQMREFKYQELRWKWRSGKATREERKELLEMKLRRMKARGAGND